MRKLLALVFLALLALAYWSGYWPQRQRALALRGEMRTLQDRLTASEARVRLAGLLGRLEALADAVSRQNYGEARSLSTTFFDEVRSEVQRSADHELREVFADVLELRDTVTERLARGDATAVDLLGAARNRLRASLGWPVPSSAPTI